jgi:predicted adenine nucleotide alpha hydrolase (AANH) superfamily ATPase
VKEQGLDLILEDEYGLRRFLAGTGPGEDPAKGGRCLFCYRLRLEKTALLAAREGYEAFSTTLLISPYQNHELLKQIGEDLADRNGIAFLYRDFRPFFREGQRRAREQGYYMQKYCGCVFSEEERYLQKR